MGSRLNSESFDSFAFPLAHPGELLPAIAHSPDRAVPVFADEKAAVFGDSNSYRATPDFAVRCDETGHEIVVFSARFARRMIEWDAHDFVTGAFHPVP